MSSRHGAVLRFFCIAVPTTTVVAALACFFGMGRGDFGGDWGLLFAGAVLFIGNLFSCALNAAYLRRVAAPLWLKGVVALQAVPVLAGAAMAGNGIADMRAESRSRAQGQVVMNAVAADDTAAFESAWAECDEDCRRYQGGPPNVLYRAADASAHGVVRLLVAPPYSVRVAPLQWKHTERTCDGDELLVADALNAAVMRKDKGAVGLILPAADDLSRRSALWLAARLDRLEMIQELVRAGVPLGVRGEVLDQNESLLVAAADGAALRVGRWLIEEQSMPVDAIRNGPDSLSGSWPLRQALGRGRANAVSVERTAAFVKLLAAHGADVDAAWDSDTPTALDEMVRIGNRELAVLLLEVGARKARLAPARQAELARLLASSPRTVSALALVDCIDSGD